MAICPAPIVYFSESEMLYEGLFFQTTQVSLPPTPPQALVLLMHTCTHTHTHTHTHNHYLKQIDCNAVTAGPNIASSHS